VHIHTGKIHVGRGDTDQTSIDAYSPHYLSLYTVMSLTILYGVWYIKRESGGGHMFFFKVVQ